MRERLDALHHITAVCSDAARTVAFYRDLGLNLAKKTVNFDDPTSYHIYFGDDEGRPGTLLTFFEWPRALRGRVGAGTVASVAIGTPGVAEPVELEDPDGLQLELEPAETVRLLHLTAYGDPRWYEGLLADDSQLHFEPAPVSRGAVGVGGVHHQAWRMADEGEQLAWRERVAKLGLHPTQPLDRKYFQSVYFRMPDGLLHELATDGPGFGIDEDVVALGTSLSLPDWLEGERPKLERILSPLS